MKRTVSKGAGTQLGDGNGDHPTPIPTHQSALGKVGEREEGNYLGHDVGWNASPFSSLLFGRWVWMRIVLFFFFFFVVTVLLLVPEPTAC